MSVIESVAHCRPTNLKSKATSLFPVPVPSWEVELKMDMELSLLTRNTGRSQFVRDWSIRPVKYRQLHKNTSIWPFMIYKNIWFNVFTWCISYYAAWLSLMAKSVLSFWSRNSPAPVVRIFVRAAHAKEQPPVVMESVIFVDENCHIQITVLEATMKTPLVYFFPSGKPSWQ